MARDKLKRNHSFKPACSFASICSYRIFVQNSIYLRFVLQLELQKLEDHELFLFLVRGPKAVTGMSKIRYEQSVA